MPYVKRELWFRPPQQPAPNEQDSRTDSSPKLLSQEQPEEVKSMPQTNYLGSHFWFGHLQLRHANHDTPEAFPVFTTKFFPRNPRLPWRLFQTHVMVANSLATASLCSFLFGPSSFSSVPLRNKVWGWKDGPSSVGLPSTTQQSRYLGGCVFLPCFHTSRTSVSSKNNCSY